MFTRKLALLPATMVLLSSSTAVMANPLTKHPVMTGIGAAMIAHHEGKKAMAHGKKPNLAERHPIMTGLAAGAIAHHMGKKK